MKDKIIIYVLWDHPDDYPNDYVIRRNFVEDGLIWPDEKIFFKSPSLLQCRKLMYEKRLAKMMPMEGDHKKILETYI